MTERQNLDPQSGPKTRATPAGVNRHDMSPAGPDAAQANDDAGIEYHEPDSAFGDPAEVADGDSTPRAPGAEGK